MPAFYVAFQHYFPSTSLSMPPKATDESAADPKYLALNDVNATGKGNASILIFISARALGSLGFAVSLFAIWFGWLLPASPTAPAAAEFPSEIKKARPPLKHPRRSTPNSVTPPLPTPFRRASAPVDLTPILGPHYEDAHHVPSRRVYFVDSPPAPIIRRNTMPEPSQTNTQGQSLCQVILGSITGSPRSSTPSLPPTPPNGTQPGCDCLDELAPASDSSRHSSQTSLVRPSSRLQKFKLGFNAKTNRNVNNDAQFDRESIASTETTISDKSAKRASGGFAAVWSSSRPRTPPDVESDSAVPSPSAFSFARRMSPSRPATSPAPTTPTFASSVAAEILSPTFLSRKAQRRTSTPIPRTSPYGAPYFASPPVLLDKSYPTYLKGLPQFEDEMLQSSRASDGEDGERSRGREPTIRRIALNPTRRSGVPKRRSASEDWTIRSSVDA
ncbi:hypothetical protein B0H34DRAFT_669859 [Crassisporium funariophilum]|nr:hypothetical protein B0H34DRAFT_669859 [Crassisporium funariophilum]